MSGEQNAESTRYTPDVPQQAVAGLSEHTARSHPTFLRGLANAFVMVYACDAVAGVLDELVASDAPSSADNAY